ncbi:MAG: molecular chaperone DnaK, partial [Desulfobulbaceae bacterium]|nr:molecular chaperone DnaK [Desulfobulbaceae bacterium]
VDAETKSKVEEGIEKLKKALETDDIDAIKTANEELTQASHKLAEIMYSQASQQQQQADASGDAGEGAEKKDDDDVVDADYEEVK